MTPAGGPQLPAPEHTESGPGGRWLGFLEDKRVTVPVGRPLHRRKVGAGSSVSDPRAVGGLTAEEPPEGPCAAPVRASRRPEASTALSLRAGSPASSGFRWMSVLDPRA